eukprot:comp22697_c0_seq1/m.35197 comp22697_c0_seq1/g.35197  ORF comp22697_c0_seq1/g.35197 comp22697_c0_seq1/m.35197 type:complete len:2304 (-) comp22697_c0_seq1:185-7096(-)
MFAPWQEPTVSELDPQRKDVGERMLQSLLDQFRVMAAEKVDRVRRSAERENMPLCVQLQVGQDPKFDQLLVALSTVSRQCLQAMVQALTEWWSQERIIRDDRMPKRKSSTGLDLEAPQKHKMAVDFLYGRVLIEVLEQRASALPEKLAKEIERNAFQEMLIADSHFVNLSQKTKSELVDVYADLIGVICQTRFDSVTSAFLMELNQTISSTGNICNVIRGMHKIKLKFFPITELEKSAKFLQDLGGYFRKIKKMPDVKQELAKLFTELLLPLAAIAKAEVNMPGIKNFVETVYQKAFKMKQQQSSMPFITMLLCVSQKNFFLERWPVFLNVCLNNVKDTKLHHVAMESINRCLWVYFYRIKGESNATTTSRLKLITSKCFPKNASGLVPKDEPVDMFVEILLFMSESRLDYVMRDVIYPLLSISDRKEKVKAVTIYPERMHVGLRAARVIADYREKQQKPKFDIGPLPSGQLDDYVVDTPLNKDQCVELGLGTFYEDVIQNLGLVLRGVHKEVGITMLQTQGDKIRTEVSLEKAPLVALYHTVLKCIPRFFPKGIPELEVISIVVSMVAHTEATLREAALGAMKRMISHDFSMADKLLQTMCDFVINGMSESSLGPQLTALESILTLLRHWRSQIVEESQTKRESSEEGAPNSSGRLTPISALSTPPQRRSLTIRNSVGLLPHYSPWPSSPGGTPTGTLTKASSASCLEVINGPKGMLPPENKVTVQAVEQLAILYLCSPSAKCRNTSLSLFAAVKDVVVGLGCGDSLVADVLDHKEKAIIQTYYKYMSTQKAFGTARREAEADLKLSVLASSEVTSPTWPQALAAIVKHIHTSAVSNRLAFTWQVACYRLLSVHPNVATFYGLNDLPGGDQVKTFTSSGNSSMMGRLVKVGLVGKDTVSEDETRAWINYLTFCCVAAPAKDEDPESIKRQGLFNLKTDRPNMLSARQLFKCFLPFIRVDRQNLRTAVINALGLVNAKAVTVLWEEIMPYQTLYKKYDDIKRKEGKRRSLRTRIAKVLEYSADCFQDHMLLVNDQLKTFFLNYVSETMDYLETARRETPEPGKKPKGDGDEEALKVHFANLTVAVMEHAAAAGMTEAYFDRRTRYRLFQRFGQWCHVLYTGGHNRVVGVQKGQLQDRALVYSALRVMSAMCNGEVFDPEAVRPESYLFQWLTEVLSSDEERYRALGRQAVELLLRNNQTGSVMLECVVHLCYVAPWRAAGGYFMALAQLLQQDQFIKEGDLIMILNVVLFMTGNPIQSIRKTAIPLMQYLCKRFFRDSREAPYQLSVTSVLPTTYQQSQLSLSRSLSASNPNLAKDIFEEMAKRIDELARQKDSAHHTGQRMILQCMLPWLEGIDLMADTVDEGALLMKLFMLTAVHGDSHPKEIEQAWQGLARRGQNLAIIVSFVIHIGTVTNKPEVVPRPDVLPHGQKVVVYLGRVAPEALMSELAQEIQAINGNKRWPGKRSFDRTKIPSISLSDDPTIKDDLSYSATMSDNRSLFALLLTVELATEATITNVLPTYLPILLQVTFLNMDRSSKVVYQAMKVLLCNLLSSVVLGRGQASPEIETETRDLIDLLSKDEQPLWAKESVLEKEKEKNNAPLLSVEILSHLVGQVVRVHAYVCPSLAAEWARTAHVWAIVCDNDHQANRSLQILRALRTPLSPQLTVDLLTRLSGSVVDEGAVLQGYVIEILLTLQAGVMVMEPEHLITCPQVVWCAIVLLDCTSEREWRLGADLFTLFMEKLPVNKTLNLLPALEWPHFPGVQALLVKGLTSKVNCEAAIDNLACLFDAFCDQDMVMDPTGRGMVLNLVSLLPYLLSEFNEPSERAIHIATALAAACDRKHLDNISKLLSLYSRKGFTKGEEQWTDDTSRYINEAFPLEQNLPTVGLLFAMLETGPKYHSQILRLIGSLLRCLDRNSTMDMDNPALVMMRALQGDYWKDALNVMNRTLSVWLPNEPNDIKLDTRSPPAEGEIPQATASCWNTPLESQERTRQRLLRLVGTMQEVTSTVNAMSVTFNKRTAQTLRKRKGSFHQHPLSADMDLYESDIDDEEYEEDGDEDSTEPSSERENGTAQLGAPSFGTLRSNTSSAALGSDSRTTIGSVNFSATNSYNTPPPMINTPPLVRNLAPAMTDRGPSLLDGGGTDITRSAEALMTVVHALDNLDDFLDDQMDEIERNERSRQNSATDIIPLDQNHTSSQAPPDGHLLRAGPSPLHHVTSPQVQSTVDPRASAAEQRNAAFGVALASPLRVASDPTPYNKMYTLPGRMPPPGLLTPVDEDEGTGNKTPERTRSVAYHRRSHTADGM